jgi:hypothetical protein
MKCISTTPNGKQITLPPVFAHEITASLPARQVSIAQFPATNPNWSRYLQLSDEYLFVKRGKAAVAISIADLINLAFVLEPGLTWTPPVILVQPQSKQCKKGDAATFTVEAGSEYDLIYQWQHSADGKSWENCDKETKSTLNCTLAGFYRCIVTDNATEPGSIISDPATLTVV